ncbi:MAG: hypothetical protein JOZ00_02010 [Mycobacterium sp.]|uniref:hypothetical protein n=1 Tax=Mycobacterium sp. TaxID=1785 RepID=UPI001ECCAA55|nr:hypothetical protein [Mycobacterium sp.]MBV8785446.1 hypothetical protein [Mycobacterium sp.]
MSIDPHITTLADTKNERRRRWPSHLFGGRVRTSTLALIIAFMGVWWLYATYRPEPTHNEPPPAQVVPPGFVPDPNYTWVPRSRVQQPPDASTPKPTPTTTATTPPPSPTPTTTAPPPFVLPTLPCVPPFCTPTTTPGAPGSGPSQPPQPGPGPVPTSAPPAS